MSKVLIIPDVHGRPFWRKAKEKINSVDKVVFLGDYLDPYGYEGITRENAIEEFKEIIQFKVDNPDKVILLLGNHDCAYCYDFGSASRYDYANAELIKEMFENFKSLFQLKYFSEGILYTHAGVTNDWLKSMDFYRLSSMIFGRRLTLRRGGFSTLPCTGYSKIVPILFYILAVQRKKSVR